MAYESLNAFLRSARDTLSTGPIGIVLAEDDWEIDSTLAHHRAHGTSTLLLLGAPSLTYDHTAHGKVHHIHHHLDGRHALSEALNPLLKAIPTGVWISYGYNGEYLIYPFRDTRSLKDFTAFCAEERRYSVICSRIDLYPERTASLSPPDLSLPTDCPSFDALGYYGRARLDPMEGTPIERQFDLYGGLAWRKSEHFPKSQHRIDRVGLFQNRRGLKIEEDHRLSVPELNTLSGEWHHSPTAALLSYRLCKALWRKNGTASVPQTLTWYGTHRYRGTSQELMELGIIEPGQWV